MARPHLNRPNKQKTVKVPQRIQQLLQQKKTVRLDVACGANKVAPDCIGMDIRPLPGVDIVHDLVNDIPWPLPDSCARAVFMSHFWEHVTPWRTLLLMKELHRVCQPGAQLLISGPYGVEFRFVQDPTHCNASNEATFAYFDKLHESGLWHVYQPPVFHLDAFEILPAGGSRDFQAFLTCCKPDEAPCGHPQCPAFQAAPAAGRRRGRRAPSGGGTRGSARNRGGHA